MVFTHIVHFSTIGKANKILDNHDIQLHENNYKHATLRTSCAPAYSLQQIKDTIRQINQRTLSEP